MDDEQAAILDDPKEVSVQGAELPDNNSVDEQPENTEVKQELKEESASSQEQPDKKNNSFQEKINKITADKHAERRRADALQRRIDEIDSQSAQPKLPEKQPALEDFDYDDEKFINAKIEYQVNKRALELQEAQNRQTRETGRREVEASFKKKVDDFQKTTPDYQQVVGAIPSLPQETLDVILTADDGEKIAYYLGNHLDVADEIASMSPAQAALRLGRISSNLSNVSTNRNKVSNAPDPVKTISSSGSLEKNLSEMSMEEIFSDNTI